ncbi:hypothetical protein BJ322DRAFT_1170927 [Thelephora terrestris]|uniref:Uncharacterized protein n=1 Tax=Thelephora terrestris TaxID=56493 RepID=A0A9P6HMX0_9AGAM|nr:hypothetical protein BJ322DRAFT_1170927 [Thelephora terrestris]
MQRSNPADKGKSRAKPYDRIKLSKYLQDRLSKYADTSQVGTPSRSSEAGKARRRHVKVEKPDEQALFDEDEDRSGSLTHDHYHSEHEAAQELQQSSRIAHEAISSDGPSEEFEEIGSHAPGLKVNFEDHSSGGRSGNHTRDVKNPMQGFFTPPAKKIHSQRVNTLQPDKRIIVTEVEKFGDDMNELIDMFCTSAKSQVTKFVNEHR